VNAGPVRVNSGTFFRSLFHARSRMMFKLKLQQGFAAGEMGINQIALQNS
jgi:hypothetical protein